MKKLLVIDDEKGITDFIARYFQRKGYLVETAASAEEAAVLIKAQPDLILLDVMMPGMDGVTFCQHVRDQVMCPILFLSAKVEEQARIEGLMAGGDDYILKPFSIGELHARVEAHLRREQREKKVTNIRTFEQFWIDYAGKRVGIENQEIELTKKEYELLEFFTKHRGQTFSKEQLYDQVWGYDAEGDPSVAVTEHIKRIRKKLGLKRDAKNQRETLIETVWGIGYRWDG